MVAAYQVTGIEDAFNRIAVAGGAPRPLVVERLRLRDAAPLLKVLLVAEGVAGEPIWFLANDEAVEAMAGVADSVKIVELVILPALLKRPAHAPVLDALEAYSQALRGDAATAGGSLLREVLPVATAIDNFALMSRQHPVYASFAPVLEKNHEIAHLLRGLGDRVFTLRHQAADGEAAEGEAADGEAAEAEVAEEEG
ncbi:unnamed protein product [Urochloa humidicola]